MPPSTTPYEEVSIILLKATNGHPYIEKNSRSHVYAGQAVGLGHELDVVRDLVAAVQTAVLAGLVRDLEKAVNLLLVDAHAASKL